ncbi:uncharacterized protein ARMOST_11868 [Armillaria ostoyae]|uniref:Uncharacterized protein n=1 Tax=Armillaria ostoyae TaxID=47428 RepID=A0A284RIC4_ARMOS|nr:uncharacterized protein ARMOST_11868 [Armillaria ostoyae]
MSLLYQQAKKTSIISKGREPPFQENELDCPSVLDTEIDGVKAFDTKDLVQLHPLNRSLSRSMDGLIMHSTGEKKYLFLVFVPSHQIHGAFLTISNAEAVLTGDKRIAAAVLFGRSKFQLGVLIQPTLDEAFDPRDVTRGSINKANEQAPQHSRIHKEMILVAKPAKPFEFMVKGTPQRTAILEVYKEKIEMLYKNLDQMLPTDVVISPEWSLKNTITLIRDIVRVILERDLGDTNEVTAAMAIRNSILRALRQTEAVSVTAIRALLHNFVFESPSIAALSNLIYGFMLGIEPWHKQSFPDQSQSVLKLRDENGEPPLIIIPGADGSSFEYTTYADTFRTAIWTLAITLDTPLTSLHDMVSFYFSKIKVDKATGPYRLASYSPTSVLLVVLIKLFEDNGDRVVQAVMLDHFPAMFVHTVNKHGSPRVPEGIEAMLDASMIATRVMMDRDAHRKQRLWDTVGTNDLNIVRRTIHNIWAYLVAAAEFVYDLATDEEGVSVAEDVDKEVSKLARQVLVSALAVAMGQYAEEQDEPMK